VTEPALFRHAPALVGRIPWIPLATLPTPVEPLGLSAPEARGADLWIKRDDLTGRPYGGNKVRKLEFLLGAARAAGAGRLITAGAAGSHHALATTIYGRAVGLPATLVLFPQPLTDHVRDVLLMDLAFGAELRYCPRMELVPAAMVAARLARRRDRPFPIAPGGSDPVGTLGYVSAALELAEQVGAGLAPRPDVIHVTGGTLGTAAGLAIGLALAGLDARILATRVASPVVTNERRLRALVTRTARLLQRAGLPCAGAEDAYRRVEIRHGQAGPGYGHGTAAGRRAAEFLAAAGIAADPTYIAKTAADLLETLRDGPRGVHLFWHTLSAVEPVEATEAVDEGMLPPAFRRYLARPRTGRGV